MTYLNEAFYKKIEYELKVLRNTYLTAISEKAILFETHAESEQKVNDDLQSLAYQKVLQEEIAQRLLDWLEDTADPNTIKAVLNTPDLIGCIYDEWLDNDYSISEEIKNTIDDYINRQRKERQEEHSVNSSEPERGYR